MLRTFYLSFTGNFHNLLLAVIFLAGLTLSSASPAILFSICAIQGDAGVSPYLSQLVTVRGVVYADLDVTGQKGFFIQHEDCDANPSTSDGIFIYTGQNLDLVNAGDLVKVTGWVNEYYGMTEISAYPQNVLVLSHANPLPLAHELNPPFDPVAAMSYFESLEGMYVSLAGGTAVGPTDLYDRTWLVRVDLGIARVFGDDPMGTGEIICADDEGLYEIAPEVKVGDRVLGLAGVMDYRFESFCLEPLAEPVIIPEVRGFELPRNSRSLIPPVFSVATFNLGNLFDKVDDPTSEDDVLTTTEYNRKLTKLAQAIHGSLGEPALLAIQEAENQAVLTDLFARPEIQSMYGIVTEEGPDRRGLDIGIIYRQDLSQLVSYQVRQGCTHLVDGLGPDGNLNVSNPQNTITCDSDGNGSLDGNRLFSRPPLVVRVNLCLPDCSQRTFPLTLVVNHWKSKTEDSGSVQYTLPRRLEQAEFVAVLAEEIRNDDPLTPLLLLGDLNDVPGSAPLRMLENQGFRDLVAQIPKTEQYSYIYEGISQALDHEWINLNPSFLPLSIFPIHINADYPHALSLISNTPLRSSDHDAVLVEFCVFDRQVYLPFISIP